MLPGRITCVVVQMNLTKILATLPRFLRAAPNLELAPHVKLSSSGKLSVALEDVVKTRRYQEDLAALRRIAAKGQPA